MTMKIDLAQALPRRDLHDYCLLLDVDGTLLDIAPHPDAVFVPPLLVPTLAQLHDDLGGALALVSGRTIGRLDELFSPLALPAVGVHGAELRLPHAPVQAIGDEEGSASARAALQQARAALSQRMPGWEGCVLEDKGQALAVHYRGAPRHAREIEEVLHALASGDRQLTVLAGKCVYELKAAAHTKGAGIARLRRSAPFAGRAVIYVGDDVTDESGFEYANAVGGYSIRVGASAPTAARFTVDAPAQVRGWLEALAA